MKTIQIIFILAFLTIPGVIFGAGWQPLGPEGGQVNQVVVSAADPDRVYAAGPNGLFRSNDGGQNWTDVTAGLVTRFPGVVAASQTNADRVYAHNAGTLYRSTDGGESWSPTSPGAPEAAGFLRQLEVDETNDQHLTAAFTFGLYRSMDGGNTWQQIDNDFFAALEAFAILPEDPDIVLAAGRETAESNPQAFRSDDGGVTWSLIEVSGNTDGDNQPFDFSARFFPAGQNGRVLARSSNNLYYSDDHGQTWTPVTSFSGIAPHEVLFEPGDPDSWYVAGQNGILYTEDNGQSFVTASTGLGPPAAGGYMTNILAMVTVPNGAGIYVGSEHAGFWYGEKDESPEISADRAAAWNWFRRNNGLLQTNIRSLAINPIHSDTVYAAYGDAFTSPSDLLWTSFNAGSSWTITAGGMEATGLRALAVDPLTADDLLSTRLYTAGYGFPLNSLDQLQRPPNAGVFRSGNSGQTWGTIGVDDMFNQAVLVKRALVLDPSSSAPRPDGPGEALSTLYVAGSGRINYSNPDEPDVVQHRIYKSTDFGDNWSPADNGLPIPPIDEDFNNSNTYDQNIIALAIDPVNPQTLYTGTFLNTPVDQDGNHPEFVTSNGVFKSIDGGQNWVHSSEGLPRLDDEDATSPHWDVYALGVAATNPDIIYAVVKQTAILNLQGSFRNSRVYRSDDGGENWTNASQGLPSDTDLRAIAVDSNDSDIVYVGGQGTPANPGAVYRTTDGGENWNSYSVALDVDSATALGIDNSGTFPVLYAGTRGGVYKIEQLPDEDFDGVPDDIEEGAPNGGDGNNDGVPDQLQPDVASLLTPDNGQRGANTYMTIEILGTARENPREVVSECGRIWNAHSLDERNFPRDENWEYPFGMMRFEVPNCSQTEIRVIFHGESGEPLDNNWQFRVFAPDEPGNIDTIRWQPLPDATHDGQGWVLDLADGQLGDLRPENGTIWVQGGPARVTNNEVFQDRFEEQPAPEG
jgi:photosystem II stability/assembly factor-like uncharacterized protein